MLDTAVGRVVPAGLVAVTTTTGGTVPLASRCWAKNTPLLSLSMLVWQGDTGGPGTRAMLSRKHRVEPLAALANTSIRVLLPPVPAMRR
ncbi:hypothetical protein D3C85_1630210 [compost metagenome]